MFEETDERAAHEHVFETITVAATCTEAGSITTKCTLCAEETVETIEALGHTNETITVAATCTEAGSITTKCTVCGEETVETTEALGHKYKSIKITFPFQNLPTSTEIIPREIEPAISVVTSFSIIIAIRFSSTLP